MMKNKLYLSILIFSIALGSCKPEIKGELGETSNKEIGMNGTWELAQFIVQDPNSPILEERDLSAWYIVSGVQPMRISLDAASHTYQVEITQGKNFLGDQGTWHLDDVYAPSTLFLETQNDTIEVSMGAMVTANSSEMKLNIDRTCASTGFKNVIYKFNFNRVNP